MTFGRLVRGPEQSRRSEIVFAVAGLVLGALAAVLGTVTHSGGIDGGTTGIVVALLTVLLGSAAFTLLAGLTGWASFGLGFLVALALTSSPEGDAIGALSQDLSRWWFYGSPAAILLGGLLAWLGFIIVDRTE